MERIKKDNFKTNDIIMASEIGQYHFCSISWFLQKNGKKPVSPKLDIGSKKHINLGKTFDYVNICLKKRMFYGVIGYILLITSLIALLFEVFL